MHCQLTYNYLKSHNMQVCLLKHYARTLKDLLTLKYITMPLVKSYSAVNITTFTTCNRSHKMCSFSSMHTQAMPCYHVIIMIYLLLIYRVIEI